MCMYQKPFIPYLAKISPPFSARTLGLIGDWAYNRERRFSLEYTPTLTGVPDIRQPAASNQGLPEAIWAPPLFWGPRP